MPSLLKPALEPGNPPAAGPRSRYPAAVIAMHWLMLAVIAVAYTFIEIKDYFPKGSAARTAVQDWHEFFGLTIFGLVILRLALRRLYSETPDITPPPPPWQHTLSRSSAPVTRMRRSSSTSSRSRPSSRIWWTTPSAIPLKAAASTCR
ncbi:hypothetical protein CDEF62S_05156 [Castellaniella defragrans]